MASVIWPREAAGINVPRRLTQAVLRATAARHKLRPFLKVGAPVPRSPKADLVQKKRRCRNAKRFFEGRYLSFTFTAEKVKLKICPVVGQSRLTHYHMSDVLTRN